VATQNRVDGSDWIASYWIEEGAGLRTIELARSKESGLTVSPAAVDSQGAAHFAVADETHLYHLSGSP